MPVVRLRVWDQGGNLSYTLPGRRRDTLTSPSLRLMSRVLVGASPTAPQDSLRPVTALLDTGSPFNIIDQPTWQLWTRVTPDLFEPLPPVGTLPRFSVAGGRNLPYHLGRTWVRVRDETTGHQLPPVGVVFQLLDRTAALPHPVILGMHDGVLDGRWLRRVPCPVGHLPHEVYDAGGYFGQEWFLQDEPPKP